MSSTLDERISDEIEALQAILMDDVSVHYNENGFPEMIETVVFPSTGEDADQQYVCVTLQVIINSEYPDTAPNTKLRNPRGLDDTTINRIQTEVNNKLIECIGQPVVFELIEVIREHLTSSNLPSGQCAICLYGFQAGDMFTKTHCYHHFHSHCLACHIVAAERNYKEEQDKLPPWQQEQSPSFQASCPVCRDPITCDLKSLLKAAPPFDVENARQFELTAELKALQAQMSALYLHQQSKGGIIDIEAEESKLLLVTQTPDNEDGEVNGSDVINGAASVPVPLTEVAPAPPPVANHHHHHHSNNQNNHHNGNNYRGGGGGGYNRGGHYKGYRGGGHRGRGGNNRRTHRPGTVQPCASTNR